MFCILCCKFFLSLFFFALFCILIQITGHFALVFMFVYFILSTFDLFWLHIKYCFVNVSMYVILGLSLFQSINLCCFRNISFSGLRPLWHDLSTNIMQTAWSCNYLFFNFGFFTLLGHKAKNRFTLWLLSLSLWFRWESWPLHIFFAARPFHLNGCRPSMI